MNKIFIFLVLFIPFISCKQSYEVTNGLVRRIPPGLIVDTTKLDDVLYNTLRQFLVKRVTSNLSDTIFIRYTFENDQCWRSWNYVPDSGVSKIVRSHERVRDSIILSRPHISLFEFREPGELTSKWIKLSSKVIIDTTSWLFNNVIKVKSTCGTSVAIFPDKTCVRFLTDPHYELLYATKDDWGRIYKSARKRNGN